MIEPIVSLAFAVHSNRGAYALLLGSGVSRAAQIPTGWEVVIDLVERIAALRSEETGGDPAGWFQQQYNAEPTYTALLSELAGSQAERSQLLRGYFEPTADERAQGLKLPTAAQGAIASLVAGGYIRVIVTTNFDRLVEQALEAEGITPTVIATPDAAEGALPLAHTACTIAKVHGDYLDARVRNTPEELAVYDERIDALLDRIFDEYGLIICGWSADWDTALRDAITRCSSYRYTTFWATRRELTGVARDLLTHRRGMAVEIADADSFFVDLEEKVRALDELETPHPLSAKLAVATTKRYLTDDAHRIRLHDLFNDEVARIDDSTTDEAFPTDPYPTREEMDQRLERYEAICAQLAAMIAVGCFWGEARHREIWLRVLDRLATGGAVHAGGYEAWMNLRMYPTALTLYAGSLGALAAGKYDTLAALLGGVWIRQAHREDRPLIIECAPAHVVDLELAQPEGPQRLLSPVSDRLGQVLREPLRELVPADDRFEETFDKFEYLFALAYADFRERLGRHVWAPTGSFGWRQRWREGGMYSLVANDVDVEGDTWGFLEEGLFDGSVQRFLQIKDAYQEEVLNRLNWW